MIAGGATGIRSCLIALPSRPATTEAKAVTATKKDFTMTATTEKRYWRCRKRMTRIVEKSEYLQYIAQRPTYLAYLGRIFGDSVHFGPQHIQD